MDLGDGDDQGRSTATTVANSCCANASATLLQDLDQRRDDPRARAAKRMSEGHRATVDVDIRHVEAKELQVREGYDREGLINFKEVNLVLCDPGMRICLWKGKRGRGGEL